MRTSAIIFLLAIFCSCISTVSKNDALFPVGWIDEDTYSVKASGENDDKAVERAKHQILKDIVDVRVRNNSKYTDIVMIREEFTAPLRNGKIIDRKTDTDGIQIHFQIYEKGLKNKFQRQ